MESERERLHGVRRYKKDGPLEFTDILLGIRKLRQDQSTKVDSNPTCFGKESVRR
ncbi:hypothetical protein D3C72_2111620 [compost metagenome]